LGGNSTEIVYLLLSPRNSVLGVKAGI